jgi:hypothetical protein
MSDCKHPQGPEAHHRFTRNVDHIGKHCLDSMWQGAAADVGADPDDSTVARMLAADAIVGRYMRQKAAGKYAEILEYVSKQGVAKVFA